MRPPNLLAETDFLAHEFPVPGNPYRPLCLITPLPGQGAAEVARVTEELVRQGYGGIIIDPAGFGAEILGEHWFALAELYVEACRLVGLFLWFMDGFTAADILRNIMDETIPNWRAEARRADQAGSTLPPAKVFNWSDPAVVSAWIQIGLANYAEFFRPHLGRTVQGFFILCPSFVPPDQPPRVSQAALGAAIDRHYLGTMREWCAPRRLRLAGYRLGGRVLPLAAARLDLGGVPDLSPGASEATLEELAALAGLARGYRQDRVLSLLPASGILQRDRAMAGRLALAGADLFIVREQSPLEPAGESALNDYIARLSMVVSAGRPANESAIDLDPEIDAWEKAGRQVLMASTRGVEAICRLPGESGGQAAPFLPEQASGAGEIVGLPDFLMLRRRQVENWQVHVLGNQLQSAWRGMLDLPLPGTAELWSLSTGEQYPVQTEKTADGLSWPLALEAGETVVAISRRSGGVRSSPGHRLVQANLPLARAWSFSAPGGNVLPLAWHEAPEGRWAADFDVLSPPEDLVLFGPGADSQLWLNGRYVFGAEKMPSLAGLIAIGPNQLELISPEGRPSAYLRGGFACRASAVSRPEPMLAGPWTLNGFRHFPGPGLYRQSFRVPPAWRRKDLLVRLDVAALADSAIVRLNGRLIGHLPWPPFRLEIGAADELRPDENQIELEVYAAANQPDGVSKGLLGEVTLLFFAKPIDEGFPF